MDIILKLAKSKTVWGAIVSLASVANMLFGIDISPELINELQSSLQGVITSGGILVGAVLTIVGRIKAKGPIE